MDKLTPEQRHKNMQAIRNHGSKIEVILGKALWSEGIRYRKNDATVFGKPDFSIKKYKIAIFCDSEFWHGKDWNKHKYDIHTNSEFWINKIENNIKRDILVSETLQYEGWIVIRFWGKEILKNTDNCVTVVKNAIYKKIK